MVKIKFSFTIYFLFNLLFRVFLCVEVEKNLKRSLLDNYDITVRPNNHTTATIVKIQIVLYQMIDLDERQQIFFSSFWLTLDWRDENLAWNKTSYNGISSIVVKSSSIWTPDAFVYNDVREEMRETSNYDAMVSSGGFVHWSTPIIMKSHCHVDVLYFPYDQQICKLKLGSWIYSTEQLQLHNASEFGELSNLVPNPEWDILEIAVRRHVVDYLGVKFDDVTFYVIMRRKPLFYIFNLVVPCIVILFVSLIGFLLPPDSGEKVALGITCLLALTVFLLLVAETLPPQSQVIPLIGQFFAGIIILLALSTASTVLVINVHFKGYEHRRVPYFLRRIGFDCLAKFFCLQSLARKVEQDIANSEDNASLETSKNSEKEAVIESKQLLTSRTHSGLQVNRKMSFAVIKPKRRFLTANNLWTPQHSHSNRVSPLANGNAFHATETPKRRVAKVPQHINFRKKWTMLDIQRIVDKKHSRAIAGEWQLLAMLLDRLLLIIFIFSAFIMCTVIFLQSYDYSYNLDHII